MELVLMLDDALAANLHAVAGACGLSLDEAGHQALLAGLEQLATPLGLLNILDLSPLHTTPPMPDQITRMPSPIFAVGPVPERILKPFDVLVREVTDPVQCIELPIDCSPYSDHPTA